MTPVGLARQWYEFCRSCTWIAFNWGTITAGTPGTLNTHEYVLYVRTKRG